MIKLKNKLLIGGLPFQKAIEKLKGSSRKWLEIQESLGFDVEDDIESVYDIFVDSATAFVEGRMTEAQIEEIDIYYSAWYGYSIREEN